MCFLKANGPYNVKVLTEDGVYNKFKANCLEIMENGNKNTFKKKVAAYWLENNKDYVDSKRD